MEKINIRKILYFAVGFLLILNFLLFLSFRKDKNDLLGLTSDLSEIIRKTPVSMFEAVLNEQIICYKIENSIIDSIMIVNEQNVSQNIYDVLDDDYKLVIRYSKFGCRQCVDSVVAIVNRTIGSQVVAHMVNGGNVDELRTYKRIHTIEAPIYKVETINPELDDLNVPYLFLINRDGAIKSPFVPHKEMVLQINNYLKVMNEKYNLNK